MTDGGVPKAGRFVWHELRSADQAAAAAFYGQVVGWTMQPDGDNVFIKAGDTMVGDIEKADTSRGEPSCWYGYVTVPDLDAAVGRVAGLGGTVHQGISEIPEHGRFARVADPTGATILPYQGVGDQEAALDESPSPGNGDFVWNELMTSDPEAILPFYQDLFGWGSASMPMDGGEPYWLFKRGEKDAAGMMKLPPEAGGAPPHWLFYIGVEDVDEASARTRSLGGTVLVEPRDIPGMGRFAVLMDPQGATFALYREAAG